MTTFTVNSDNSLQSFIGEMRTMFAKDKFIKVSVKTGKARSLDQNGISHVWYEQLARELKEDDALGWKCYSKLHHGVPILRSEDDDFRECYDLVIKPLSYDKKLIAMRSWPVTSLMNKEQLSKYLEAMQTDFRSRGVLLEFPEVTA